ncbi:MAG: hypothetical protein JWO44_2078 [Bacteroidetes bacterium]|nr:hypothetical protein [Bacteroidota bacterium]
MKKIKFFVEGEADRRFLIDFLKSLDLSVDESNFIILSGNDEAALNNSIIDFQRNTDNDGINLLIFDADEGHKSTLDRLESVKRNLKISFVQFLFPNNKDSGTLEHLLISVVPKSNKVIFDCFDSFEECLKADDRFNPPILKTRVYAYVDSLLSKKERKEREKHADEKYRNYLRKDHWDLTSPALEPLRKFLETHLN